MEVDPLWLGISITAFALVVFGNGYRLFEQDIDRRMGLFHMFVAASLVPMVWVILWMNGELS